MYLIIIQKHGIKEKKTKKPVLSRMYLVNPKDRKRYFIRLLLLHVKGVSSFQDLRTVDDIIYSTFYEASIARHLVNEDKEWDRCLEEATQLHFPTALCELFAYICIFHNPINARDLYEK